MAPGVLGGEFYLAYVHSQTNLQTCTTFGANWSSRLTASPDFRICDPLKAHSDNKVRLVFRLCPFQDESADVNQSWCQSVQPFDSFPDICYPLKTPQCPLVSRGTICLAYISIPRRICTCVPNVMPIGTAVW